MNKKQVAALLKIMYKSSDRPVIASGYVDAYKEHTVLVATDGYTLAAVHMDGAEELIGKMIRREAIEKWYKLATSKSRLTGEELVEVSNDDYASHGSYQEGTYPEWQGLIPTECDTTSFLRDLSIGLNASYLKNIQDAAGEESIRLQLYGTLRPIVVEADNGLYILMPTKR